MKISSLQPDSNNANRGTARGRKALAHSLKEFGAGRSILIDKKGRVIAGDKTLDHYRMLRGRRKGLPRDVVNID